MAYVVVVSGLINVMALVAVAYFFWGVAQDYPRMVQMAVDDAVRKQDDRIEKRLAKAAETAGNGQEPLPAGIKGIRAGQSVRR